MEKDGFDGEGTFSPLGLLGRCCPPASCSVASRPHSNRIPLQIERERENPQDMWLDFFFWQQSAIDFTRFGMTITGHKWNHKRFPGHYQQHHREQDIISIHKYTVCQETLLHLTGQRLHLRWWKANLHFHPSQTTLRKIMWHKTCTEIGCQRAMVLASQHDDSRSSHRPAWQTANSVKACITCWK